MNESATRPAEPRFRVLAVDDEPGMRRAMARSLEPAYVVDQASSAAEALELAGTNRYDIAIVDVRMPEVDGFELLEALKIESPDTEVIMITGSQSDAAGKLVRAISEKAFYFLEKPFDRAVLRALVDRAAEISRLERQNREYVTRLRLDARRMEEDLATARTFQQSLLPQERPRHPALDLFAHYAPHSELGGDFYDFHLTEGGALHIALADVAGHGVSAALLTGMFKVHLEAVASGERSPRSIMRELNRRWFRVAQGRFATLIYLTINRDADSVLYASGGHPPAILLRKEGGELLLEATGVPVGAFAQAAFEEKVVPLDVGDTLFLYTDGLTEAENSRGESLPWERLRGELVSYRDRAPRDLVGRARRLLANWVSPGRPADDVSVLALKRVS